MAALENTVTTAEMVTALDIEMAQNFDGGVSRLMEVLGIFGVEVMAAGTALYQTKVTGALSTAKVAEGDEVPLSKYQVQKVPVGELEIKPYRKLTTAQSILKGGFAGAVTKTDAKMVKDVRAGIWGDFFALLAKGTGTAKGAGLQGALAFADATLRKAAEDNGDEIDRIVHFVNPLDIAGHLAVSAVSLQTVYGMQYLQSFLGVTDIFVTSKVDQGTIFATPVENLHIYGADFGALGQAGLEYTVSEAGLIGVHHSAAYDRTSAETYVLTGMTILPEVLDYIVKGTIEAPSPSTVSIADGSVTAAKLAPGAVTGEKLAADAVTSDKIKDGAVSEADIAADSVTTGKIKDGSVGTADIADKAVTEAKLAQAAAAALKMPTSKSTTPELEAFAAARGIDLAGARNNEERLSIIKAELDA